VLKYLGTSRTQTAKVQIQNVEAGLQLFRLDVGPLPDPGRGAERPGDRAFHGAGVERPLSAEGGRPDRPWSAPYLYRNPGKHSEIDVYSLGSDKAEGGGGEAADVGNW